MKEQCEVLLLKEASPKKKIGRGCMYFPYKTQQSGKLLQRPEYHTNEFPPIWQERKVPVLSPYTAQLTFIFAYGAKAFGQLKGVSALTGEIGTGLVGRHTPTLIRHPCQGMTLVSSVCILMRLLMRTI